MSNYYNFDKEFIKKVVALILQDLSFVRTYRHILNPVYFQQKSYYQLAYIALEYFDKYRLPITQPALLNEIKQCSEAILTESQKEILVSAVPALYSLDLQNDAQYIRDNIVLFGKKENTKRTMLKVSEKIDSCSSLEDMQELDLALLETTKVGIDVGRDLYDLYDEAENRHIKLNMPIALGIPTNISVLDKYMPGKGALPGEFNVMFAPTNAGKSHFLVHLACVALQERKKILYVTCEMPEENVGKRFDSYLTDTSPDTRQKQTWESFKEVYTKYKLLGGNVKFLFYPSHTMNTNMLEARLDRAKTLENWEPDLVIIDYISLMAPNMPQKDKRLTHIAIYEDVRRLVQSRQCCFWTVDQADSDGVNKQKAWTVLDLGNFSEAFGKTHGPDSIITMISRKEDMINHENDGTMKFMIAKLRDGAGMGRVFTCKIDFSTSRISDYVGEDEEDPISLPDEGPKNKYFLKHRGQETKEKKDQGNLLDLLEN